MNDDERYVIKLLENDLKEYDYKVVNGSTISVKVKGINFLLTKQGDSWQVSDEYDVFDTKNIWFAACRLLHYVYHYNNETDDNLKKSLKDMKNRYKDNFEYTSTKSTDYINWIVEMINKYGSFNQAYFGKNNIELSLDDYRLLQNMKLFYKSVRRYALNNYIISANDNNISISYNGNVYNFSVKKNQCSVGCGISTRVIPFEDIMDNKVYPSTKLLNDRFASLDASLYDLNDVDPALIKEHVAKMLKFHR